jgi:transposase
MTISNDKLIELKTAARYVKNKSQLARDCKVSRSTVVTFSQRQWVKKETKKRVPLSVLLRRRAVKKLSEIIVETEGGRRFRQFSTANQIRLGLIQQYHITASKRTIIRDLHASGKKSRMRRKVCTRDREDLAKRQEFKMQMKHMDAHRIVFSDETWLSTKERTGLREWVSEGEHPNDREDKSRRNLDSFQVWAAVGYDYKSELIIFPVERVNEDGDKKAFRLNGADYNRRCLGKVGASLERHNKYLQEHGYGELLFQQDHAKVHDAKVVDAWFERKKIQKLTGYPTYSPDLNMIEAVWKDLHAAIGELCPETEEELRAAALQAWAAMDQKKINAHVLHFTNAVKAI